MWLWWIVTANLAAQGLDIGVKGGVPLGHFVLDQYSSGRYGQGSVLSQPRRYLAGPVIDVQPVRRWSIETSVLYRRFGYDFRSSGITQVGAATTLLIRRATGSVWEAPVVWKPHVSFGPARGYLGAGFALRTITGVQWREHSEFRGFLSPPRIEDRESSDPSELNRRTAIGAVLSAGLEFRVRRVRLSPEIRYTHWDSPRAGDNSSVRINRDQVDAALNIGFIVRERDRRPMFRWQLWEPGVMVGVAPLPEFRLPTDSTFSVFRNEKRLTALGASLGGPLPRSLALEVSFLTREFAYREVLPYATFLNEGRIWEPAVLLRRNWKGWFVGAGMGIRRTSSSTFARGAWGPAMQGGWEKRSGHVRFRFEGRYHYWSRPLWDFSPSAAGRQQSLYLLFGVGWAKASASQGR